jgi:GDP-4-dehydro-6-deoxy-D-mannose reductase
MLVTGGAGFAGGHALVRYAGGGRLVAWRRPRGSAARPIAGVEWQAVNLTDHDAVVRHIARLAPTVIVHLAGAPNVRTSWQNVVPHVRTNVLGTHHLLEAVRLAGHRCRVLVVSSAQVYQASEVPLDEHAPLVPSSPYGLTKLAQEQLALRSVIEDGLAVVVARPFNHAGPGQAADFALPSFARQIARIEAGLERPIIRAGNLDARRDMTDVRDVVDAYLLLAACGLPGEAYNVCSGRAPAIACAGSRPLPCRWRPIPSACGPTTCRCSSGTRDESPSSAGRPVFRSNRRWPTFSKPPDERRRLPDPDPGEAEPAGRARPQHVDAAGAPLAGADVARRDPGVWDVTSPGSYCSARSACTRASVAGCVENRALIRPRENGFMMNMWAVAGLASSGI